MATSERRIVTVRKVEEARERSQRSKHDTLPAPPPSDHDTERDDRPQDHPDTIPAGETSEITDVIVIPPHRRVRIERDR